MKRSPFLRSVICSMVLAMAIVAEPAHASGVQLTVGGSTQMLSLGNLLAQKYATTNLSVNIGVQPSSGLRGFQDTCQTALQFGMTDTYIQDNQLRQVTCDDMINIPVAVTATPVVYNLPGAYFHQLDPNALCDASKKCTTDGFTLLHPVRFTAQVIADIYMGKVKRWNDPEITSLNPGMALPAQQIHAFNSSEPGSTAFVFNQWLCFSVPAWNKAVGVSIAPAWPTNGSVGTPSTGAMVQNIVSTPYSIGFAGFDFAISYKLQAAALRNASGFFKTPSLSGIARAIGYQISDKSLGMPIDFRRSFVTVPGKDAFNPADFEFFVVHKNLYRYQPNIAVRQAVKDFLTWAVAGQGGQKYIESIELHKVEGSATQYELAHGYVPVPGEILAHAQSLVSGIMVQQ